MSILRCLAAAALTLLLAAEPCRASEDAVRVQLGIEAAAGPVLRHRQPAATLSCNEGPDCHGLGTLPRSGTAGRLHLAGGVQVYEWLVLGRLTMALNDDYGDVVWRLAAGRQLLDTAFGRTFALVSAGYEDVHLGAGIGADGNSVGVLLHGPTIGIALRQQKRLIGSLSLGAELSYDLMFAGGWSRWDDGFGEFDGRALVGLLRGGVFLGVEL